MGRCYDGAGQVSLTELRRFCGDDVRSHLLFCRSALAVSLTLMMRAAGLCAEPLLWGDGGGGREAAPARGDGLPAQRRAARVSDAVQNQWTTQLVLSSYMYTAPTDRWLGRSAFVSASYMYPAPSDSVILLLLWHAFRDARPRRHCFISVFGSNRLSLLPQPPALVHRYSRGCELLVGDVGKS